MINDLNYFWNHTPKENLAYHYQRDVTNDGDGFKGVGSGGRGGETKIHSSTCVSVFHLNDVLVAKTGF